MRTIICTSHVRSRAEHIYRCPRESRGRIPLPPPPASFAVKTSRNESSAITDRAIINPSSRDELSRVTANHRESVTSQFRKRPLGRRSVSLKKREQPIRRVPFCTRANEVISKEKLGRYALPLGGGGRGGGRRKRAGNGRKNIDVARKVQCLRSRVARLRVWQMHVRRGLDYSLHLSWGDFDVKRR